MRSFLVFRITLQSVNVTLQVKPCLLYFLQTLVKGLVGINGLTELTLSAGYWEF